MTRSKISFVVVIMLTMFLSMSVCAKASNTEKPKELTKVVFAEAVRGEGWLPIYLAQELGYFKDEGIDPKFVTFRDGPVALMSLLNGDAQFCIIGFEPVLMAFDKGEESKVILTTLDSQPYTFVSRSGLKDIKDFKGKVVFGGMAGSAPYYFVKTALRNAGIDPDKEVTFANLNYGAELVAMSKGDLDGGYVRATRFVQVDEIGGNVLVDATDPAQHKKIYGSELFQATVVQVSDEYIKEHPEVVQGFTNAVYKAIKWQNAHSDAEVAKVVSPFFPGRNIDAPLIKVLRRCLSEDGQFSEEGYRAVVDFCIANGVIKKDIPMSASVDQTFIKKAKEHIK
ncbi:ABC transporter substrate-binding protein [Maridesulfovibrio frigidus]|uniref:ABC transporter substrate-binding protein n=1 Tax=Maridesulfovibrio frigidus TaxID=340956 RepID=UPI0004E237FF|nr:ABC transporter substrate-binding protein [Maridesulfovibrio frigidus]